MAVKTVVKRLRRTRRKNKMKAKFITVKGSERLGREPFYEGVLQHERTMSRREAYEYIAGRTGYTPTAVRAVFMAVARE